MVSYWVKGRQAGNKVKVLILIVMDNGLLPCRRDQIGLRRGVLILIVMDNGLLQPESWFYSPSKWRVLILIVMDNGLLQADFILSLSSLLS